MGKVSAAVSGILRAARKAEDLWGDPVVTRASVPEEAYGPDIGSLIDESGNLVPQFATGKPVTARVFHASRSPNIDEFKNEYLGSTTQANSARMGHFFAGSPATSNAYPGSSAILPAPNSIIGESDIVREKMDRYLRDNPLHIPNLGTASDAQSLNNLVMRLKSDEQTPLMKPKLSGQQSVAIHNKMRDVLAIPGLYENLAEFRKKPIDAYFGGTQAPSSYPVMLNMKNPLVEDWRGGDYQHKSYSEFLNRAKAGGHDSAVLMNTEDGGPLDNIFVTFDPTRIRSQFAAFDPANIGKPDIRGSADPRLLAPMGAAAAGGLYGAGYLMDKEQ